MSPTTPSPGSAEALLARGEKNFLDGDYDAAIAKFSEAIRLRSSYAEAYLRRGWSNVAKQNTDEAIADFTEVIRLWPDYADAYYARGFVYLGKGRNYQAIKDCSDALRRDTRHADAYFTRGFAHQNGGNNSSAIEDFTEAIRIKPDYADAYLHRGSAYVAMRMYNEALSDCIEANRLTPGCADTLRKNIMIESSRRSLESRLTTMTLQEAEHIIFEVVLVAMEDKRHRYRPISALKGYDMHQICVAYKLVIANQFLGLAHRKDSLKEFENQTQGAGALLLAIQTTFVPDDHVDDAVATGVFDSLDPQFLSVETPDSFGRFCVSVGADHPLFWQKIYTRLGLEYNEKSPKGNNPVQSDSNRPERDRESPTTGCAIFLAALVLQGIVLVVWLISGFAYPQISILELLPSNPSFPLLPDALARWM